MGETSLTSVRACVFDAYGTLFDFASAVATSRDRLGDRADRLVALWRDKQLQYTWLRGLQGRHADFWEVTGDALDFALDTLGIHEPGLRERLLGSYLALDAFPEVPGVLATFKQAGIAVAILSNGSQRMLDAVVRSARLAPYVDHVLSVDQVGVFKPHPLVYQLAVDTLRVPADQISFQSSNAWDAFAASALGMKVVWCNRYGQWRERLPGAPDREVTTLATLPAILGVHGQRH
jgi:2-haloacid dehalogenase